MTSYYYTRINRRDFGDILSEGGLSQKFIETAEDLSILKSPSGNAVIAVWTLDPRQTAQLPEALICQEGTQNDWAAWITTYAVSIRPFSAYMRLMTDIDLQLVVSMPANTSIGSFIWPISGLILGEVLASGLPDSEMENLSATAFASTLSFVMCRTAAIFPNFNEWVRLIEKWVQIRNVTGQRTRHVDSSLIARVCAIILEASGFRGASSILAKNDLEIVEACHSLLKSPQFTPATLFSYKIFTDAEAAMHGSREDRVRAFGELLRQSYTSSEIKPEILSFMLGYFASRIAPRTIKHSSVLSQVTQTYPTAMLWYGFCAGLNEVDEIRDVGGRHFIDFPSSARRIIRELVRPEPVLGAPTCDIGYLELIALSRAAKDPFESLTKSTPGFLVVELLPGVYTSVYMSRKFPNRQQDKESREREFITMLGEQIDRLKETYERIIKIEASSMNSEQLPLIPPRRKKNS